MTNAQTSNPNNQNGDSDVFAEYTQNALRLNALYVEFYNTLLEKDPNSLNLSAIQASATIYQDIFNRLTQDPEQFLKSQAELWSGYVKVWGNILGRSLGEENEELITPPPKDRRFQDEAWQNNLFFDFIKQSYLLTGKWLRDQILNLEGVDHKTIERFDFYTQRFVDAMAPSNFAMLNPEVLRTAIETKGENLVRGFANLLHDFKEGSLVKTVKESSFTLGEDLASTKGSVVFQNDLMQLIQYHPTQKKTYEIPILLVPAWINKYYILDLSEQKSMAKWLLDQGYTVFIISWKNPDASYASKDFSDYMMQGPITAIDFIQKRTKQDQVNLLGYCLGGTLVAATLGYLVKQKDQKLKNSVKSASLLTTMVDFCDAGEIQLLLDEQMFSSFEQQIEEKGYFDGSEMATIFSLLRANDLIWSYVINNYLLGRDPFPFDMLYWNSDTTRLPAQMHIYYLRKMYLENALPKANTIELNGTPIDMGKVTTPLYILSCQEDHIAPWPTTYQTTKLVKGSCTFTLASSGHVAGVINPPAKNKYSYWVNDILTKDHQAWLDGAKEKKGSWWPHWQNWLKQQSGNLVTAPKPQKPLEEAPGGYVRG